VSNGFREKNSVERQGSNRLKREVMLFWGMHPNGKFDRATICYALDYNNLDIDRELVALVQAGLVDIEIHDGVPLYSLTTNEEKRRPIVEWASPGHRR
jgi:hypothetical protein